jgi:predicted AAA+ superfamily ATPase
MAMRPMSFSERGVDAPTVSLRALLAGESREIGGSSEVDVPAYTDEILRSGFPGIRDLPERARRLQLDSYVARIVERELPENGVNVRRPGALRAWLAAYAAATATNASYTTILDAATPGEGDKPARQTAGAYREHLQRIFVLDPLEAWIPTFAPLKRLTYTPKHHLVDPAIAARLLGVEEAGLLRGEGNRVSAATGTWLGALFESLVTQSVRVYADAAAARVGHLRTKNGNHEVDLIVEGDIRSCIAIEAKLTSTVDDHDVRHLNWLHQQIGDRLVDRIVVYTGRFAYRRGDGVAVVPLALLGP